MITTGTYGEDTRLLPVEKMQDYKMPPPLLTRSPGHIPRLHPRLQGRRPGLLQLQRGRAVRRMDAARRDRAAHEGKLEYDPPRCGSPTTPKPTST